MEQYFFSHNKSALQISRSHNKSCQTARQFEMLPRVYLASYQMTADGSFKEKKLTADGEDRPSIREKRHMGPPYCTSREKTFGSAY